MSVNDVARAAAARQLAPLRVSAPGVVQFVDELLALLPSDVFDGAYALRGVMPEDDGALVMWLKQADALSELDYWLEIHISADGSGRFKYQNYTDSTWWTDWWLPGREWSDDDYGYDSDLFDALPTPADAAAFVNRFHPATRTG